MALSAAEEETLESVKRWWNESGRNIVIVLVVAGLVFLAWQLWQNAQMRSAAAASEVYERLTSSVAAAPGQELSSSERARALQLAQELREEHGGSVYALYGALFSARLAVEAGDLDQAEQNLQWLLDNRSDGLLGSTNQALVRTAQLRLARVVLAKEEAQRALTILEGMEPGSHEAEFAELKGDIHVALGQSEQALESYSQALQAGSASRILQMKLDSLSA